MFVRTEEAPALNFLIRVLTPIVYLIIASAALYYFGLDKYVYNIFLVNVYYIIFRLLFNLISNRGLLLNWYRQFLYWTAIIVISYFTYDRLIKVKANILPDLTTVANELWIIILIFVFQVTNNMRFSHNGTVKRKQSYLKSRYNYFKVNFGNLIKDITQNEALEAIVYSIIIYEDFNRPKIARHIENLKFRLTKRPHTLGVMQVKSDKWLNDIESVKLGSEKIVTAYKKYLNELKDADEFFFDWKAKRKIIGDYNGGERYSYEIIDLSTIIMTIFYKDSTDTLEPKE